MKMKLTPITLALACLLAFTGCAGSPGSVSTPTKTVEEFTQALDEQDLERALQCCDSGTNTMASTAFGVADGVMGLLGIDVGIDSDKLIYALAANAAGINTAMTGNEWSIDVECHDLKEEMLDDSHAKVTGTWVLRSTVDGRTSQQESQTYFDLVKEGGEWKVALSDEIISGLVK